MEASYAVQIYACENGKEPFNDWLKSLKFLDLQSLVLQRLQRIRLGNFGDCKPIKDGLWEFRIHFAAGYRIYYTQTGKRIVLLLCAGDKNTQHKDIRLATQYLSDYRRIYGEK